MNTSNIMIIVDDECGRRNAVDLRYLGELHEFYVTDERRQEFVYFIFICILAVNQFLVDKGIAPDKYLLLKLQLQQKKQCAQEKVVHFLIYLPLLQIANPICRSHEVVGAVGC
jgi:hypothetical protein